MKKKKEKALISGLIVAIVHAIATEEIHAWFARHGRKCPCGQQ